ncbi:FkbM family methyltransferase [Spirulina sp. CCNP1310]|uniref:FkbM family methyltransferase n=1 Tax=Spirulina sp. CCNP1310 TaxID=3110249 RepID=UPI002B1ED3A5|nr:FkbM family methyltransferase [Spirulina sp. CCNP1310]MEA5420209.1 FkbM family methyltransferase [Spirulina sp. CCNP1310]
MKIIQWFNFLFAQYPLLYWKILTSRKQPNFEKLLFLSLIQRGDVVIDIGANRGYYTVLFSHIVGNSGKVYAFEPIPSTFEYLTQTLAHEQIFSNVIPYNCALGDQLGEAVLYLPDHDDGQASMRPDHQTGSWKTVQQIQSYICTLQTLDHYCQNWPRLDFIKCDVEGAELLVLKGGSAIIQKHHPMVYVELFFDWTKAFDYHPLDLLAQLMDWGYQQFYICNGQFIKLLIDPIPYFQEPPQESINLLCTIPECHGDRTTHLEPICTKAL